MQTLDCGCGCLKIKEGATKLRRERQKCHWRLQGRRPLAPATSGQVLCLRRHEAKTSPIIDRAKVVCARVGEQGSSCPRFARAPRSIFSGPPARATLTKAAPPKHTTTIHLVPPSFISHPALTGNTASLGAHFNCHLHWQHRVSCFFLRHSHCSARSVGFPLRGPPTDRANLLNLAPA